MHSSHFGPRIARLSKGLVYISPIPVIAGAVSAGNEMLERPLHIFYVEGNQRLSELIELSLTKFGGFITEGFSDTDAAFAGVERNCPDAILVDAAHVNGATATFLKQLRARPEFRDVPVVLASDRKRIHQIRRYKAIGATAVIPTPINPFCLPQTLRDVCASKQPPRGALSGAAPDPAATEDSRTVGIIEHAGLAR